MEIGLIGLPGCGKTTCFSALTGLTITPGASTRVGVVTVPEPRIDRLNEIYTSRKLVYPEITFVDTPALDTVHGAGAIEKQLARLAQEADAFALVLQCFGTLDHGGKPLDPAGDLESLMLELALADLGIIERRIERLRNQPKKERNTYEDDLLARLQEHLSAGRLASLLPLSPEEEKLLRAYQLITMRPLMVVANVGDDDLAGENVAPVLEFARSAGVPSLHFCAALEAEIAQLPAEDQEAFLADYGLAESARSRLIRTAYELLDVITFLTAGEKESHAWTIKRNLKAPQAAGKIHSDFEAAFIRAEVVAFADLDQHGTMAECRKHGLVRLEGRDYVVQDGDILDIRFSR